MELKNYKLPINFGMLTQRNQELPACALGTSIAQNVFLIVSSSYKSIASTTNLAVRFGNATLN